jgi:exosortase/archaeosortase family protein
MKLFGMATVIISFLVGFSVSLGLTSLTISDSNPNTYIAVVMLMLPVFLIFSLKEKLVFSFERKNIAYGALVFVIYVLTLSYARVSLSYTFNIYRIDALLAPLFLSALILIVFGLDGLKKLKIVVLYGLFASPIILAPVIALNSGFTAANAGIVYGLLRMAGLTISSSGILTTGPSSVPITIASTCTDLGLFIALVMLLVPIAYLLKGELHRKALWICSAVVLMLAFNMGRMFYISYTWITAGASTGLDIFHSFAGELLFYAALIIIILVAPKYGLLVEKIGKPGRAGLGGRRGKFDNRLFIDIALALLIGVIALFLSLPYANALNLAPLSAANATNVGISLETQQIAGSLEYAMMNVSWIGQVRLNVSQAQGAESYIFALTNASYYKNYSVFALVTPSNTPISGFVLPSGGTTLKSAALLLQNGISLHYGVVESNGTYLSVAYFSIPYTGSTSSDYINYQFISAAHDASGYGAPMCGANTSEADYFESEVYDTLNGDMVPYGGMQILCPAYRVASSV